MATYVGGDADWTTDASTVDITLNHPTTASNDVALIHGFYSRNNDLNYRFKITGFTRKAFVNQGTGTDCRMEQFFKILGASESDPVVEVVNAVITGQDETIYDNAPTTEGTFNGGSGFDPSPDTDDGTTITLTDGTIVTIDNVAAGGDVDQFTVDSTADLGEHVATDVLSQVSTTAPSAGTGFSLTLDTDNISVVPSGANVAAVLDVFRTIDGTPHDVDPTSLGDSNDPGPPTPAITPVTDNGVLIVACALTSIHGIVYGKPATPTFTDGQLFDTWLDNTYNNTFIATAYQLDYGTTFPISPSDWTNTGASIVVDNQTQANYDNVGANGTFTPGTGYAASDTMVMTGGAEVTVNTVGGGGEVATFSIDNQQDVGGHSATDTLTVTSGGSGSNFDLTLDTNNITNDTGQESVCMTTALKPAAASGSAMLTQQSNNQAGF